MNDLERMRIFFTNFIEAIQDNIRLAFVTQKKDPHPMHKAWLKTYKKEIIPLLKKEARSFYFEKSEMPFAPTLHHFYRKESLINPQEKYKQYLLKIIPLLLKKAKIAKQAVKENDNDEKSGILMAYYGVFEAMHDCLHLHDIKPEILGLQNINPDRDFV